MVSVSLMSRAYSAVQAVLLYHCLICMCAAFSSSSWLIQTVVIGTLASNNWHMHTVSPWQTRQPDAADVPTDCY